MIDAYSTGTSNGHRVICMLEETGLAYRPIWTDIVHGEHRTPEFLSINPYGAIPVIVDHDAVGGALTLTQSATILIYLAEKSGRFLPSGQGRIQVLEWLMYAIADLSCASASAFQLMMAKEETSAAEAMFARRVRRFLEMLEHRLNGNEYLAGDYSIADICLYPNMLFPAVTAAMAAGDLPNAERWIATVAARPAMARALAITPLPGTKPSPQTSSA